MGLTHDELEWELVLYWLFSVSPSVVNVLHPACIMGVAGASQWCADPVLSGELRVARHTAGKVLPCGETGEYQCRTLAMSHSWIGDVQTSRGKAPRVCSSLSSMHAFYQVWPGTGVIRYMLHGICFGAGRGFLHGEYQRAAVSRRLAKWTCTYCQKSNMVLPWLVLLWILARVCWLPCL